MYSYKYPRAAITVDAIVYFKEKNKLLRSELDATEIDLETYVLLIERGREPFKNKWALPGGFIEMDETLEEACKRELLEETGLFVPQMTQFKTYDAVDRDPRHRTISTIYFAEIEGKRPVKGDDDASRAEWFSIHHLPELAFDHLQIMRDFFGM